MKVNLASIGLFSGALSVVHASSTPEEACLTPSCVRAAANVLNNLHPDYESIDPCENFDQYVCGGFPSRFPNEEEYNTLLEIGSINTYVLKSILDSSYSNNSNSTPDDEAIFNMLATNYNSCMNETAVNSSAIGGVPEIITKIDELFPLGENGYSSNDTITEQDFDSLASVIVYLSKIGVPVFGEFWTVADPQFPDVMVPQFGINAYTSSDHALPSAVLISEFSNYTEEQVAGMLELILPAGSAKNASSSLAKGVIGLAKAIEAFEASLASDPLVSTYAYSTATVAEAVEKAPALVLDKVITELAPEGYELDRMVFQQQDIYTNISKIVSETPKATLQVLMMLVAYNSFAPYLAGSITPGSDRWEFCYTYVDQSLPWIAGKFFLDRMYSNEKRELVKTMAEELKTAFSERVQEKDWLSDETKTLILEKASEMIPKIGYPDHTPDGVNATDLLQYYKGVDITSSLYDNVISIRKWTVNRAWKTLKDPADPTIWPEQSGHAYHAEARYGFNYNHIVIPSGITQAPALHIGAPSYLMYGAIGLVAGHEVTHGFDTNGRLWNNNRQYKTWWDDGSVEEFKNRTQCFVDQFSEMQVLDSHGEPYVGEDGKPAYIDGTKTLSENIADSGGLANAWAAWKKHEEEEPSQLLPGLEKFTKEQLFFVGMGQMWCSTYSQEKMREFLKDDGHAPPFARIRGVTANSKEFREVWQCEKKEPVCELW